MREAHTSHKAFLFISRKHLSSNVLRSLTKISTEVLCIFILYISTTYIKHILTNLHFQMLHSPCFWEIILSSHCWGHWKINLLDKNVVASAWYCMNLFWIHHSSAPLEQHYMSGKVAKITGKGVLKMWMICQDELENNLLLNDTTFKSVKLCHQ